MVVGLVVGRVRLGGVVAHILDPDDISQFGIAARHLSSAESRLNPLAGIADELDQVLVFVTYKDVGHHSAVDRHERVLLDGVIQHEAMDGWPPEEAGHHEGPRNVQELVDPGDPLVVFFELGPMNVCSRSIR